MSGPCSYARAEEARQAGWMSRRHQNPSSRDAAMLAHARREAAKLTMEERELELPSYIRAVLPRTKPRVKPVVKREEPKEPKETPKPETK